MGGQMSSNDLDLLFLYDGDMNWFAQSAPRIGADLSVGVKGGVIGLKNLFDRFVGEGKTFKRAVFETHGQPGGIVFGEEKNNCLIDADVLSDTFARYGALFPRFGRIYFSGCNVADKDEGWKFLETAGKVFFQRGGGITFGWTSAGFAVGSNLVRLLSSPVSMLATSGKVLHPWGDARYVWTIAGGQTVQRWVGS
jgi:hypothetical protein